MKLVSAAPAIARMWNQAGFWADGSLFLPLQPICRYQICFDKCLQKLTLKLPWPKPLIGFRGPLIWLSGSPCLLLEINECSCCSTTPFVLQSFSPVLWVKLNNEFSGVDEEHRCRQMHIYNLYRCVVMQCTHTYMRMCTYMLSHGYVFLKMHASWRLT